MSRRSLRAAASRLLHGGLEGASRALDIGKESEPEIWEPAVDPIPGRAPAPDPVVVPEREPVTASLLEGMLS